MEARLRGWGAAAAWRQKVSYKVRSIASAGAATPTLADSVPNDVKNSRDIALTPAPIKGSGVCLARPHPPEDAVLVDQEVLECSEDVNPEEHDERPRKKRMNFKELLLEHVVSG